MAETDWDYFYGIQRARQFEYGAKWPASWELRSLALKRAADHLYNIYHDAILRGLRRDVESFQEAMPPGKNKVSGKELEGQELEDAHDGSLVSIYLLLMGYAIENLLKGILILTHPEYFKVSGKMKQLNSHDLVRLCERCGIAISQEERDILDRLSRYIIWLGKYPVPLASEEMLPQKRQDGTWEQNGVSFSGRKLQQQLDAIWGKFLEALEKEALGKKALGVDAPLLQIKRGG